jgi:hypothetical protein
VSTMQQPLAAASPAPPWHPIGFSAPEGNTLVGLLPAPYLAGSPRKFFHFFVEGREQQTPPGIGPPQNYLMKNSPQSARHL